MHGRCLHKPLETSQKPQESCSSAQACRKHTNTHHTPTSNTPKHQKTKSFTSHTKHETQAICAGKHKKTLENTPWLFRNLQEPPGANRNQQETPEYFRECQNTSKHFKKLQEEWKNTLKTSRSRQKTSQDVAEATRKL